ncbi:MAG: hypothetical protein M1814_003000 [Vezdaea aestivalis]|nr:MAG: hypothetical protein M1814_003000 [Vezdaea aestivalis]
MGLLNLRDLVSFPTGDNSSDVLINGVHFNKTALDRWNYTLWSNNTISNMSSCYLIFDSYQPNILANGSFVNAVSCYEPYYPIAQRGALGITFACLFAATIVFSLIHLRKHGSLYLPAEKRFRPVGRRWQWYWQLFVAACGMISGFTGVDVDRAYLQGTPIILQNFFYFLMMPGLLSAVWEAVRHWGSWQERQIYDAAPFSLPQNDRRGQIEFWMPLVYYLFAFMNFFMTVPRSWTSVQWQHSPEQALAASKPGSTDGRFKAGAIFSVIAFLTILYNLSFSIKHYTAPRRFHFLRAAPPKFLLIFLLLTIKIGYQIAIAWDWYISPLKYNINSGWLYGLGYAPVLLILVIFDIWGYIDPNEDQAILAQRRQRGDAADAELGYVRKPRWWRAVGNRFGDAEERLKKMVHVGGGDATAKGVEKSLELKNLGEQGTEWERERTRRRVEDPFADEQRERGGVAVGAREANQSLRGLGLNGIRGGDWEERSLRGRRMESRPVSVQTQEREEVSSTRTMSSVGTSLTAVNPQQIRSMLDI